MRGLKKALCLALLCIPLLLCRGMREEGKVVLTEETIRTKRIEAQTAAISEAVLLQMEKKARYDRGSEDYENAAKMIQERVKQILEDKNRPLV